MTQMISFECAVALYRDIHPMFRTIPMCPRDCVHSYLPPMTERPSVRRMDVLVLDHAGQSASILLFVLALPAQLPCIGTISMRQTG